MKVIVKGVHVHLTKGLKAYVEEHLVAPMHRFYENEAAELQVHLVDNNGPKGGLDKECRVTIFIPNATVLHITEVGPDLYQAICFARDRLERAAKRTLARRRERSSRSASRSRQAARIVARRMAAGQ